MNVMSYFRSLDKPKTLIAVSLFITVTITLSVMYAYYRNSLIHLNGELNSDFFSAFGTFLSSTVGIVLSFTSIILIYFTYKSQQQQLRITTDLVDRQISLTVKPDLVIKDYHSVSASKDDIKRLTLFFDGFLPADLQRIELILNVGIEVARYIEFSFEYDVKALQNYIADNCENCPLSIVSKKNSFIQFDQSETNQQMIHPLESIQKKDYLLPFKHGDDNINTFMPYPYLIMYYYAINYNKKDNAPFQNTIPPCKLNVSYNDLEGVKTEKIFILKFNVHSITTNVKPYIEREINFKLFAEEIK